MNRAFRIIASSTFLLLLVAPGCLDEVEDDLDFRLLVAADPVDEGGDDDGVDGGDERCPVVEGEDDEADPSSEPPGNGKGKGPQGQGQGGGKGQGGGHSQDDNPGKKPDNPGNPNQAEILISGCP